MDTLERILNLKKQQKLTDAELERVISLKPKTVYDWKRGKSSTYNDNLPAIADYFGVTTDYLLGKTNVKVVDQERNEIVLDDDTLELIDSLRTNPELKLLFSVSKKATKEDIIQAVKIIEALKRDSE